MASTVSALVWLLLLVLPMTTTLSSANQNVIRVSPSPCDAAVDTGGNLSHALLMVGSNETIFLEAGEHCIRNFCPVHARSSISLVGESENTTVRCEEGLGLAFLNISSLSIQNLTIDGCGLTGLPLNETVSRLDKFFDLFIQIPDASTVALLLGLVENLWMEQLVIKNTAGLGLVGVNVIGNSVLKEVEFSYNVRPAFCLYLNISDSLGTIDNNPGLLGGGAFFVYYDYLPGQELNANLETPTLEVDHGKFLNNSECTYAFSLYAGFPASRAIQRMGYVIGGGAGLTVVLAQLDYGVDVRVNSSVFRNNTARYGSGMTIDIFSGVRNTYIGIDNCSFLENGFSHEQVLTDMEIAFAGGGAGVAIVQDLSRPDFQEQPISSFNRNLLVEILNSYFIANGARGVGGGMLFYSFQAPGVRGLSDVSRLLVSNCIFRENSAPIGAAIWMIDQKLNGRNPGALVELRDIRVEQNNARPLNSTIAVSQDNAAVTDFRGLNVSISGTCYFRDNLGTGLQASGSTIGIDVNATVYFERNSGVFGGAMTFLFYSYLILNANSSLYVRYNVGKSQGGAFYINLIGSNSAAFFDDCFLYFSYDDFGLCDEECADLNSTGVYVEFVGNAAVYDGSISYGSNLQFCPWAVQLRLQGYDEGTVFRTLYRYFPTVFNFSQEPSTAELVTTTPRQLVIHDAQPTYSVFPGGVFYLNLSTLDGLNNTINSVLGSYVLTIDGQSNVEDIQNSVSYLGNIFAFLPNSTGLVPAGLVSTENHTVSVVIYSVDCLALAQQEIVIKVGFCPSGFVFNEKARICQCDQRLVDEGITCVIANQSLVIPDDHWYGPLSEGSSERVVYGCIGEYCEPGIRYISVQNDSIDYDVQCAVESNRGGFLCGACKEGYSIVLGSDRCLKCNNGNIALILLFLALGILLILMISYLQITLTGGYLNGVLFYSNIVSLYGSFLIPVLPYDGRLALASFLSLNLGIETCFHDGMSALEKVFWQLSYPLYLVLLMLVIRGLARCFKLKRGAGFSTIQAIATLSILCYVSILQSCFELLGFVMVESLSGKSEVRWVVDPTVSYFRHGHGALAFLAICLLIFYIIPLPLCLLFPNVLYRVRFFRKLKPFYDAFWNPFEPRFRFWLGLRLIIRWVPFALVFLQPSPQNLFGTAVVLVVLEFFQLLFRPFQGFWRNLSDGLFLLNLIILFLGSLYFRAIEGSYEASKRDEFMRQAAGFSSAFITLAYFGFAAILTYHVIVRFQKLKERVKRIRTLLTRGKKEELIKLPEYEREPVGSLSSQPGEPAFPSMVTFTELREPLLETEGSLQIVSLPPTSRPVTEHLTSPNTT